MTDAREEHRQAAGTRQVPMCPLPWCPGVDISSSVLPDSLIVLTVTIKCLLSG